MADSKKKNNENTKNFEYVNGGIAVVLALSFGVIYRCSTR